MSAMEASPEPSPPLDAERLLLDTVLVPHRSLNERGLTGVMIAVSVVSFGAGLAFYLMGAWPVVGFLGLDVLLIYIGLRINLNRARAREALRLTDRVLTIDRVSPEGAVRRTELQPYWLRVDLADPVEHDSKVWLSSHGRSVSVGNFLAPSQRASLATALRDALRRLKEPQFPA